MYLTIWSLSEEHSLVEIVANSRLAGNTLLDLDIRAKYGINIVAIKRGKEVIVSPLATEVIHQEDILIVIGSVTDISRFEKEFFILNSSQISRPQRAVFHIIRI